MNRKLVISAGHSGHEVGTVSKLESGLTEEKLTKQIVGEAALLGVRTVPFVSLADRTKWVNKNMTADDVLVEIHFDITDSAPGSDCGIYYYSGSDFSENMAKDIGERYRVAAGLDKLWVRGDKTSPHGRLGIIRDTTPIAFILEMADIDDVPARQRAVVRGATFLKSLADYMAGVQPAPAPTPPAPVPPKPTEMDILKADLLKLANTMQVAVNDLHNLISNL